MTRDEFKEKLNAIVDGVLPTNVEIGDSEQDELNDNINDGTVDEILADDNDEDEGDAKQG